MIKCQACGKNPATVHLTEIVGGEKREKHLCENCAVEEGIAVGKPAASLSDWLSTFVSQQQAAGAMAGALGAVVAAGAVEGGGAACEGCGLTYNEFRQRGLLGCPKCYKSFEQMLMPLIQRAHENAERHIGRAPPQLDRSERRQYELVDLRRRLRDAVAGELYEDAARIRDRIKELEN
jgi:protein arginine kinase activator